MTEPAKETPRRGNGRKLIALAALAGAAIGVAAIYGIGMPDGNSGNGKSCAVSLKSAQAAKPLATGEVAAFLPTTKPLDASELVFNDADGTEMTLNDFAGKTVLLNLWATWCAPCRKEMPALDRLQGLMGGDDFEVAAVNVDVRPGDRPKKFLDEIGVKNLTRYTDDKLGLFVALRSLGRATGLPATMLVGPDGCEIGAMYGPAEWDSADAQAMLKAAINAQN